MADLAAVEDPRAQRPGICGVTVKTARFEFICVRKVHAKVYQRRNGQIVYDNNPTSDKHLMVNRWPYRNMEKDDDET